MTDRVYQMAVWGQGLSPETFHAIAGFARQIAGDTIKASVVDVPVTEGEVAEFERETFGYTGEEP